MDFDGFQFRYFVKNCGNTPANNIRMLGDVQIVEPGTDVTTLDFGGTVDDRSRNSLGPGTRFLGPKRRIKTTDIYDSAYGKKAIFTWVRIEYDDIFGVKHETEATGLFEYIGKVGELNNPAADLSEIKFTNSYVGPRNFVR